ncbi:MAG: hypothetical protein WCW87_04200 [Candidatus Paceibacterota bacterium]
MTREDEFWEVTDQITHIFRNTLREISKTINLKDADLPLVPVFVTTVLIAGKEPLVRGLYIDSDGGWCLRNDTLGEQTALPDDIAIILNELAILKDHNLYEKLRTLDFNEVLKELEKLKSLHEDLLDELLVEMYSMLTMSDQEAEEDNQDDK